MRLAAISVAGLVLGLYWFGSILGECDRADCGQPQDFFFDTWFVGAALIAGSLGGLLAGGVRGISRLLRRED
jgi:hypothetical protein